MGFLSIHVWTWWGIVAVICFIVEIFLPSFWTAMFGISAVITAFVSLTHCSFVWQIAVFSIFSIVSGIFFRPVVVKILTKSSDKRAGNVDAMIGKKVKVVSEITFGNPGKIKIGSEVWKAVTKNENEIFKNGEIVVIASVEGATVTVKANN